MGLDISTRNDYMRFNWSGARSFRDWCEARKLPNPFGKWSGSNGETMTYPGNQADWKKYVDAFATMYPEMAEMGNAEAVQNAGRRPDGYPDGWVLISAHAWYILLRDALANKSDVYFG